MNKICVLSLASFLLLSGFIPTRVLATRPLPDAEYTLTTASMWGPRTLDPHRAYDTVSGHIIMNVYETLIDFKEGLMDEFVPELATSWAISPDGLTYTFTIRTGVTFSDGRPLTPADVEYSFERGMVRDPLGGPMWMYYEPLIGLFNSRSYPGWPETIAELGHKIDDAITRSDIAGTITFHLVKPFAPFLQIVAQTWSSIVNRAYMTRLVTFPGGAADYFDWPGWNITGYSGWFDYNDNAREEKLPYFGFRCSPLDEPPQMMGTGPFIFVDWVKGEGGYRSLRRNKSYWGGWPAGATGTARAGQFAPSRGYLEEVIEYQVRLWEKRKLGFLAGTYDSALLQRGYHLEEIWRQPGTRSIYPIQLLLVDALVFNFNIADGVSGMSPYVGSERWETGLPLNAFSDINMRKGFAYSFNYAQHISNAYLGEAIQPPSPCPRELYFDPSDPRYGTNLTKAASYFSLAWGGIDANGDGDALDPGDTPGEAWSQGFNFTYVYLMCGYPQTIAGAMLSSTLEAINPKFHMDVLGVDWAKFLDEMLYEPTVGRSIIPMCIVSWGADYSDPHNFFFPFMHSLGPVAYTQGYINSSIDEAVDAGNYDLAQRIYFEDCPSVCLTQPLGRHWERDWVQGFASGPSYSFNNPACGGSWAYVDSEVLFTNLYTVWKEDLLQEDVNSDGKVNILDITTVARAFGSYFVAPDAHPRWNSRVDLDLDLRVTIIDMARVARKFGWTTPPWTPP